MQIESLAVGMYQANCYAVISESSRKALIIDPGEETDRIQSWLEGLQAEPEAIFITHGHFDHIGAAVCLAQSLQVPILASLDELDYMKDRSHPIMEMTSEVLDAFLAAAPQMVHGLHPDDVFSAADTSWLAIEVPGHSDHSLCLYAEKENLLFTGDTLFAGSVGRTDVYHGSPLDLVKEIKEKLLVLPDETLVYPGHGPETSIAQERRMNPFFRR